MSDPPFPSNTYRDSDRQRVLTRQMASTSSNIPQEEGMLVDEGAGAENNPNLEINEGQEPQHYPLNRSTLPRNWASVILAWSGYYFNRLLQEVTAIGVNKPEHMTAFKFNSLLKALKAVEQRKMNFERDLTAESTRYDLLVSQCRDLIEMYNELRAELLSAKEKTKFDDVIDVSRKIHQMNRIRNRIKRLQAQMAGMRKQFRIALLAAQNNEFGIPRSPFTQRNHRNPFKMQIAGLVVRPQAQLRQDEATTAALRDFMQRDWKRIPLDDLDTDMECDSGNITVKKKPNGPTPTSPAGPAAVRPKQPQPPPGSRSIGGTGTVLEIPPSATLPGWSPDVERQLAEADIELERLRKQIQVKDLEVTKLNNELVKARSERIKQARLGSSEEEAARLNAQQEQRQRFDMQELELNEKRESLIAAMSRLEELQSENDTLQKQNEAAQQARLNAERMLTKQAEAAKQETDTINKEISMLKQQLSQTQQAREAAEKAIQQGGEQITAEAERTQLDLQQKLRETLAQLKNAQIDTETARMYATEQEEKRKRAEQASREAGNEASESVAQLALTMQELASLRHELNLARTDSAAAMQRYQSTLSEMKNKEMAIPPALPEIITTPPIQPPIETTPAQVPELLPPPVTPEPQMTETAMEAEAASIKRKRKGGEPAETEPHSKFAILETEAVKPPKVQPESKGKKRKGESAVKQHLSDIAALESAVASIEPEAAQSESKGKKQKTFEEEAAESGEVPSEGKDQRALEQKLMRKEAAEVEEALEKAKAELGTSGDVWEMVPANREQQAKRLEGIIKKYGGEGATTAEELPEEELERISDKLEINRLQKNIKRLKEEESTESGDQRMKTRKEIQKLQSKLDKLLSKKEKHKVTKQIVKPKKVKPIKISKPTEPTPTSPEEMVTPPESPSEMVTPPETPIYEPVSQLLRPQPAPQPLSEQVLQSLRPQPKPQPTTQGVPQQTEAAPAKRRVDFVTLKPKTQTSAQPPQFVSQNAPPLQEPQLQPQTLAQPDPQTLVRDRKEKNRQLKRQGQRLANLQPAERASLLTNVQPLITEGMFNLVTRKGPTKAQLMGPSNIIIDTPRIQVGDVLLLVDANVSPFVFVDGEQAFNVISILLWGLGASVVTWPFRLEEKELTDSNRTMNIDPVVVIDALGDPSAFNIRTIALRNRDISFPLEEYSTRRNDPQELLSRILQEYLITNLECAFVASLLRGIALTWISIKRLMRLPDDETPRTLRAALLLIAKGLNITTNEDAPDFKAILIGFLELWQESSAADFIRNLNLNTTPTTGSKPKSGAPQPMPFRLEFSRTAQLKALNVASSFKPDEYVTKESLRYLFSAPSKIEFQPTLPAG